MKPHWVVGQSRSYEDGVAQGEIRMLWLVAIGAACRLEQILVRIPYTYGTQRSLFDGEIAAYDRIVEQASARLRELGEEVEW